VRITDEYTSLDRDKLRLSKYVRLWSRSEGYDTTSMERYLTHAFPDLYSRTSSLPLEHAVGQLTAHHMFFHDDSGVFTKFIIPRLRLDDYRPWDNEARRLNNLPPVKPIVYSATAAD
jgi:hypothetical protein